MFGSKRLTFSKSFEHFYKPFKPSIVYSTALPSRYLKPASIRCYSNEDELKAYFVSFGYSFESKKSVRRIFKNDLNDGHQKMSSLHGDQFQLHCGYIPHDVTERELFEIIQLHGNIREMCLMMDVMGEKHRGFAFIKFFNEADQRSVMEKVNDMEIRPGKQLKLSSYKSNRSLYVANIPKTVDATQLRNTFEKHLAGITNVTIYRPFKNNNNNNINNGMQEQNRGFCFLEFQTHEMAWKAKRWISIEPRKLFSNNLFVDWADEMDTPTDEIMQNVRILYVKNVNEMVTEIQLNEIFGQFGEIERVKRLKNFAFIHFVKRSDALKAMQSLQNLLLCGENLLITLSYPPLDKQKKEEMLRMRQERIAREYSIHIRY